jgi:hypothetical protein
MESNQDGGEADQNGPSPFVDPAFQNEISAMFLNGTNNYHHHHHQEMESLSHGTNHNLHGNNAGRLGVLTGVATAAAVAPPVAAENNDGVADTDEEEDEDKEEEEEEEESVTPVQEDYVTCQANASIAKAKSCVELIDKPGVKRATKGGRPSSWVWNFMKKGRIVSGKEEELRDCDSLAYHKILENKGNDYVCTFCFNQHDTTLYSSIRCIGNAGNAQKHYNAAHEDELKEYYANNAITAGGRKGSNKEAMEKKRSRSASDGSSPDGEVEASDAAVDGEATVKMSGRSYSHTPKKQMKRSASVDSAHIWSSFKEEGLKKGKSIVNEYHTKIVKWATDANIPARAICSNQQFDDVVSFALRNGPALLKAAKGRTIGFRKFVSIRKSEFDKMMNCINHCVLEAREYYKSIAKVKDGKPFGFINVGHDIWESAQRELLGVSVYFWNPIANQYNVWAIGLSRVPSHSADDVSKVTLALMARCGIEQGDLYRPVNDTTSAALKAGRLLCLGKEGTCTMHSVSLALEHATGLKTRRRGNRTVDTFPEFVDPYKKAKDCFGWLMNTKAKSRHSKYSTFLHTFGRKGHKIYLPNATRIAGIHRMYVSGLRSRWNLQLFFTASPVGKNCPSILNNDEWKQLAEYEAVLLKLAELTQMVQTDRPGSISIAWLLCFLVYIDYVTCSSFLVADVDENGTWRDDDSDKWDAIAALPSSEYRKVQPGAKHQVRFMDKPLQNFSVTSKKLVCRIRRDILFYLTKPTTDQMIAMASDPLTATIGLKSVQFHMEVLAMAFEQERNLPLAGQDRPTMAGEGQDNNQHPSQMMVNINGEPETDDEKATREQKEDWMTNYDNFVTDLKATLKQEIMEKCGDYLDYMYPTTTTADKKKAPGGGSNSFKELTEAELKKLSNRQQIEYKVRLKERQKQLNSIQDTLVTEGSTIEQLKSQAVDDQIERFFSQELDWRQVLLGQQAFPVDKSELDRTAKTTDDLKENLPFLSSQFHALEWWEVHGKRQFPLIYLVASSILSLPESNGHQERVFSSCTWMDGKLQRRQNPATHEMKALLYQNRSMLSGVLDRLSLSKSRLSKEAYNKVMKMHVQMSDVSKELTMYSEQMKQDLLNKRFEGEGMEDASKQQEKVDEEEDAYGEAVLADELEEAIETEDDEDAELAMVVQEGGSQQMENAAASKDDTSAANAPGAYI